MSILSNRAPAQLPPVQAKVLSVIEEFRAEKGFAPTYSEIAVITGKSKTAARLNVEALIKRGSLNFVPGVSRSLLLTRQGRKELKSLEQVAA